MFAGFAEFVLLALVALVLIVAAVLPKEFQTEREILIDRPVGEVFDYVKFVKNQDHFGPWQLSDPDMQTRETGVDGTVGFKYSWEGTKTGSWILGSESRQKLTLLRKRKRLNRLGSLGV